MMTFTEADGLKAQYGPGKRRVTPPRRKPAAEDRMPPETEASLLAKVTQTARAYGFLVAHTHDSRHSESGFPDLLMVHPATGRLIFAELKKDDGVVETLEQRWRKGKKGLSQQEWLDALGRSKAEVYVWRPRDQDAIEKTLKGPN